MWSSQTRTNSSSFQVGFYDFHVFLELDPVKNSPNFDLLPSSSPLSWSFLNMFCHLGSSRGRTNWTPLLFLRVGPCVRGSGQRPGSRQHYGRSQPRGQNHPAQSGSSGTFLCSSSWGLHMIWCVRSRLLMSWSSQGHADKEPWRHSGSGEWSTWSRGGIRAWNTRSVTVGHKYHCCFTNTEICFNNKDAANENTSELFNNTSPWAYGYFRTHFLLLQDSHTCASCAASHKYWNRNAGRLSPAVGSTWVGSSCRSSWPGPSPSTRARWARLHQKGLHPGRWRREFVLWVVPFCCWENDSFYCLTESALKLTLSVTARVLSTKSLFYINQTDFFFLFFPKRYTAGT